MTTRPPWSTAQTLTAALFLAVAVPAGAARGTAAAASQARRPVRLPGHVLPALAGATRLATPADADMSARTGPHAPPLTLTVVLKHDDQAGFERYLHDLEVPGSPSYRRFLTQREIADRFGPSRRSYDRLLGYLRAHGLRLAEGSANRLTLTVRGTRADVERALAVHIADYRIGDRTFHANDADPALPAELASHVLTVAGLSNLAEPQPSKKALRRGFYKLACQLLLAPIPPPSFPIAYKICSAGGVNPYKLCLTAAEQAAENDADLNFDFFAYNGLITWERVVPVNQPCPPNTSPLAQLATPASRPGRRGQPAAAGTPAATPIAGMGQTIALIQFDSFQQSDVADYLTLLGLPEAQLANLSQVHVNGGAPLGPDQDEVLLDVSTVMTLAPKAKVVVYDAPFTGPGTSFQALFNAAVNGGATIISNSWAYCEDQTSLADVQGIDAIFQTARASNISIFNAAGDSGSTCLDGSPNTVAVPAGSPNATAVGGSSVRSAQGKSSASETWWDGAGAIPPTGQGGFGTSRFFARPSYQDGFTTAAMRSVPDVVANADPANGVMICQASAGGCPTGALYGGTSYTAPLWAAYTALLNEALGRNIGFVNAALYPLAGTEALRGPAALQSDFAHVGLGSPNVNRLIARLRGEPIGTPDPQASLVSPALETQLVSDIETRIAVPADGAAKGYVVVTLLDVNRSVVSGKTVSLAATPGSQVTIMPASGVSDDHGEVVFTVTNLAAEDVAFTATDTTDGITLAQTPTFPFVVPSAAGASIGANPTTVTADGVASTTVTVTLQDARGRGAPGKEVTLSQGGGRSVVTGPIPRLTDGNGQVRFTATNLVNETVTYTAVDQTDGGLPVPGDAQVTFGNGNSSSCAATLTPPAGANGAVVAPWATGFVAENFFFGNVNWGGCPGASSPTFRGDSAYVANFRTGGLFQFGLAGGAATSGNVLATLAQTLGQPTFGKDGSLYATFSATTGNFTTGSLVQLNPTTGAILRTVASNLTCPAGLAVDPLSGDLFFDDACTGAGSDNPSIFRVVDPTAANPPVVVYATLPTTPNGALAFAPNGTLYAVTGYFNNPMAPVVRIAGTNTPSPPAMRTLTGVTTAFGVTVGETLPDGEAKSLLVSPNGALTLVDITAAPVTSSVLATNLGPGTIGPDGCMYASGNTTVYKVTNATGGCGFAPTNPSPQLSLTPAAITPNPAQGTSQAFTAAFRNLDVPAGMPVFFEVTGANPRVQMVRTTAGGQATLTYTAASPGRDVIVASAIVGPYDLESNAARLTWDAGQHVTFLTLNPSPTAGSSGQPLSVRAALADISVQPPAPVAGAEIDVSLASARCAGTTDAQGIAACQLTPGAAGIGTLLAAFAGTTQLRAASDAVGFTVVGPGSTTPVETCAGGDCNDGDACSADTCVAGQCQHAVPPGYGSVNCYLAALQSSLQSAARADVRPALRKALLAKVKRLGKLVQASQRPGKRGAKAQKKLRRQLDTLAAQLQRLRGGKIAVALDDTLLAAARGAKSALA